VEKIKINKSLKISKVYFMLLSLMLAGACNKNEIFLEGQHEMQISVEVQEVRLERIFGEDEEGRMVLLETLFHKVNSQLSGTVMVDFVNRNEAWIDTDNEWMSYSALRFYLPDTLYFKTGEPIKHFDHGWNHSHSYELELNEDQTITGWGRWNDGFGGQYHWNLRISN